jgi:hypothetical protein
MQSLGDKFRRAVSKRIAALGLAVTVVGCVVWALGVFGPAALELARTAAFTQVKLNVAATPGTLTVLELTYNWDVQSRKDLYHRWIVDRLLSGLARPLRHVTYTAPTWAQMPAYEDLPVYNDSLVIFNVGSTSPMEPALYAARVRAAGAVNVGLAVTNSECPGVAEGLKCAWERPLNHTLDPTYFDYVFRMYAWTPFMEFAVASRRVLAFWPLGPGRYVPLPPGHVLRRTSQRRTFCFFSGAWRGDRGAMVEALRAARVPCWLGDAAGADAAGINRTYVSMMEDTVFAPTPYGNNPETFRFWEALERGAIPVMSRILDARSDFVTVTGIPVLYLDSWSDVGSALLRFLPSTAVPAADAPVGSFTGPYAAQLRGGPEHGDELDELQRRVQAGYARYMARVRAETASIIDANFAHTGRHR